MASHAHQHQAIGIVTFPVPFCNGSAMCSLPAEPKDMTHLTPMQDARASRIQLHSRLGHSASCITWCRPTFQGLLAVSVFRETASKLGRRWDPSEVSYCSCTSQGRDRSGPERGKISASLDCRIWPWAAMATWSMPPRRLSRLPLFPMAPLRCAFEIGFSRTQSASSSWIPQALRSSRDISLGPPEVHPVLTAGACECMYPRRALLMLMLMLMQVSWPPTRPAISHWVPKSSSADLAGYLSGPAPRRVTAEEKTGYLVQRVSEVGSIYAAALPSQPCPDLGASLGSARYPSRYRQLVPGVPPPCALLRSFNIPSPREAAGSTARTSVLTAYTPDSAA